MNRPSSPLAPLCAAAAQRERRLLRAATPWLHDELAQQMAQRLSWLARSPTRWLDWEPHWGGRSAATALAAALPGAQHWVTGDGESAPLARRSLWARRTGPQIWDGQTRVDLVWANMGLRSVTEPDAVFAAWLAALRPGGVLMFSTLGPGSLRSLRTLYRQQGWGEAATEFVDMHDWGDQLLGAGFADPVLDASLLELTYSSAQALLEDLRAMGRNTHALRHPGLRTPRWRQAWLNAVQAGLPRDAQGRLVIELEIIWGQAWRGEAAPATDATTVIAVDDLRAMLRRGRTR